MFECTTNERNNTTRNVLRNECVCSTDEKTSDVYLKNKTTCTMAV